MAEEQIVVDFDDRALFDSALADISPPAGQPPAEPPESAAPPQQPIPPTTAPSAPGQPARDELGRFAPRQQEPAAAPTQPQEESNVPSWRLREEREQREAYAARLAERERQLNEAIAYIQRVQQAQQPQPQPPDPLLNPAEWNQYQTNSMAQMQARIAHQLRTNQLESNLQLTRMERGPELFDEAYQAFMQAAEGDVAFARSVVNAPNPGATMCDWYQRAKALETYGADPEAYFNSRLEALLKDRTFLAKAIDSARAMAGGGQSAAPGRYGYAPPSNNVTVLPPSLTSMRSGSTPETGISGSAGEDLMSDQALFAAALAPGQTRR